MFTVLVPLADGFEEIEAVTIIDILRRAGAEVITAGLNKNEAKGSHGISVPTDQLLGKVNIDDFDMIVLPGGMPGMENLRQSNDVLQAIRKLNNAGRFIAAICASTVVLEEAGIIDSRSVTGHPSYAKMIVKAHHTGSRVEVDGNVVTGQAAGSAMEFAFKLVELLFSKEKVEEINRTVLAKV